MSARDPGPQELGIAGVTSFALVLVTVVLVQQSHGHGWMWAASYLAAFAGLVAIGYVLYHL